MTTDLHLNTSQDKGEKASMMLAVHGFLKAFVFLFCALLIAPGGVSMAAPPAGPDNPRPDKGDIVLPMPNGSVMVFRKVQVPGQGYWGDKEQIIQMGDASGGIFEGLQRTQISGSFPDGEGQGQAIYLAKYELTKGQFAAVMGLDTLIEASADPEAPQLAQLEGRALQEALMVPLSFVSYYDIQEFIRRYNQWLFAPGHPERLENMPHIDGIPGFIRLSSEEEWEFTVRGGLPALKNGTFNDRLPFALQRINEHAWHLGNASHRVRPIGLRQPCGLGFHDMLGNVQEMTAGFFRPEVWQGKPGGVSVRGGSVSTPVSDMRSSLRQELDVYAWNQDEEQVQERRSFNTGARLAIGSNVVVNTRVRAAMEREYQEYKDMVRRAMPVGRTLDNLVAQAAGQLGDVESILGRLMEEHPHLSNELHTVQEFMDQARQRLDKAQRESARSLAQDAARNGVNLSVYISRLVSLENSLKAARRLAEMSSRYLEQVSAVEKRIEELSAARIQQFQAYSEKVGHLGEYGSDYIDQALETLRKQDLLPRENAVLELLSVHVQEFSDKRRADRENWLAGYEEVFKKFEQ